MKRALPLWLFILTLSACTSAPITELTGPTLLNKLIAKNEAARKQINGYSYHIETQYKADTSDNHPVYHGVGQVRSQNNSLYSVYRQTILNVTDQRMEEIEKRVVINDDYTALWPLLDSPIAFRYDHKSVDQMDPKMATRVKLATPLAVVPYAFGDGVQSLRQARRATSSTSSTSSTPSNPSANWDAIPLSSQGASQGASQGPAQYLIRRFDPAMNNPQQPQATWQIDPAKNFLITQSTVYKNDGSIWIQRTLNIQQIESDLYFPVAFDEQYHGATRDAPNTNVTRWQKATLMDVRLNPAFKSQQFQIDALNLSRDMPNITVFRKQLDGKQKLYQYRGSELIEQGATR